MLVLIPLRRKLKMKKFLVFIFAIGLVLAFTVPTYAEFTYSFKGDVRMETYSVTRSKEFTGFSDDDTDTTWSKDNVLSRFSVTAKSDNIKGYIEIRPNVGSFVRHWFGEWDFGVGKLLVGKTWTPATFFTNSQNYYSNGIAAYGNLNADAARVDQIRLTFGDFVLGFLDPSMGARTTLGVPGAINTDITIPNIEATYTFKLDFVKLQAAAGYGTYSIDTGTQTYDVDSYFIGAEALFNFGPMYANIEGHIASNGYQYGLNYGDAIGANRINGNAVYEASSNSIKDNDSTGYLAAIGYKISDMLKVEAGYSHLNCKQDISGANDDDASWYYVMLPITVAPGVTIAPEIGKIDEGKGPTGLNQGDQTYAGATWTIAF
jgi:hypothetical protein